MEKRRKEILLCGGLFAVAIIYTLLVKYIDVQEIGPNDSLVGFATINNFMFNLTGVNMLWYDITNWWGFVPLFIALDRKSTRLNSSHVSISYAVFCLKKNTI